ncbi:MAG: nucleotide disphospho-sugar-binding domain-containing protein, partial [Pseudonocardiaceae bacterium]
RLGLPRPPLEPATTIDIRPPSLGGRETPSQWLMRYVPYNESMLIPDWALVKPPRPRVALTMGSVLPRSGGLSVLTKLLATLADMEVEIVLALGNVELPSVGELPDNVRSVGWMPLSALLPNCAVIVHHAGAGTSMTALASGVPHVVIPHNADQPVNAAILADRDVGIRLDPANVTPEAVRDGLERLLTEPGFRDAASEVHDEIAGQPAPTDIVTRIELLMS